MAYDLELAERLRRVLPFLELASGEEIGETKMFGGLCFTLNGKMLVGVDKGRLVVRLDDDDYSREFAAGRALPMDFTGRPLRNFAFVGTELPEEDSEILEWATMSAKFVRAHMLGKPAKKRKKA